MTGKAQVAIDAAVVLLGCALLAPFERRATRRTDRCGRRRR